MLDDIWQDMQDDIGGFTDKTFEQSTIESKFEHLREELDEVIAEPNDKSEWADCMILFLDAARKAGLNMNDLYLACEDKMKINKQRKWGEANAQGIVKHID